MKPSTSAISLLIWLISTWMVTPAQFAFAENTPVIEAPVIEAPIIEAQLQASYRVEVPDDQSYDLSGLTLCHSQLLTISDKNNSTIFRLVIDESSNLKSAKIESAYQIVNIANIDDLDISGLPLVERFKRWWYRTTEGSRLDWEGISCDNETGNLYLVSEEMYGVYQFSPSDPASSRWISSPLFEFAKTQQANVFNQFNAGLEGITFIGDQFILALERDAAALMKLTRIDNKLEPKQVTLLPASGIPSIRPGMSADISDLAIHNNKLYTLERSISAVCRRDITTFKPELCLNFYNTENKIKFKDAKTGLAEGLAIDNDRIYVLTDTNGKSDKSGDRRPILFIFANTL